MKFKVKEVKERKRGFDAIVEIDGDETKYGFSNKEKWDEKVELDGEEVPRWLKHIIEREKKLREKDTEYKKKYSGKEMEV